MKGNADIVEGQVEKGKGRLKKAAGDLTGNEKLRSEGQGDKVKGSLKKGVGRVKNAAQDLTT